MAGGAASCHDRTVKLLAVIVASLLLGAPPPARSLPTHGLDERHAGLTITVEAGDRVVVRLQERAGAPWRAAAAPALPLVPLGDPAGSVNAGQRSFRYQLRGAGEAELAFVRSGTAPMQLRYRIVAR